MSGCERGCIEVVCRIMGVYGDAYGWLNERDLAFWKDCEGFDVDLLRFLVGERFDVNVVDMYGRTPLYIALLREKSELAKALIADVGADVSVVDKWGRTPLYIVCEKGHTEIVQLLIDAKADVNMVDKYEETPLQIACEKGYTEIVQLLIDAKADVNMTDKYETPLQIACEEDHIEIAELLIDYGADANVTDKYETPLQIACEKGHTEIIQLLIKGGAVVNVIDRLGRTPIYICFYQNQLHLLPIFRQAYIEQHLLTPPQLTSFPNINSFSRKKIVSVRFLGHTLHHSLSRRQIRGYMDKRGLVLNGMIELVVRFPDILSLEEDERRAFGYYILLSTWNIDNTCSEDLLFWESEGGYEVDAL